MACDSKWLVIQNADDITVAMSVFYNEVYAQAQSFVSRFLTNPATMIPHCLSKSSNNIYVDCSVDWWSLVLTPPGQVIKKPAKQTSGHKPLSVYMCNKIKEKLITQCNLKYYSSISSLLGFYQFTVYKGACKSDISPHSWCVSVWIVCIVNVFHKPLINITRSPPELRGCGSRGMLWLISSFVVMDDEVVNFWTQPQSIQDMNQDQIQYEKKINSSSSLWGLFLQFSLKWIIPASGAESVAMIIS